MVGRNYTCFANKGRNSEASATFIAADTETMKTSPVKGKVFFHVELEIEDDNCPTEPY